MVLTTFPLKGHVHTRKCKINIFTVRNSSYGKVMFSQFHKRLSFCPGGAWQGVCVAEGMHGGGMHGGGMYGGACMVGGMCVGGHVCWGGVWQGVGMAGDTATAVDRMHSCYN